MKLKKRQLMIGLGIIIVIGIFMYYSKSETIYHDSAYTVIEDFTEGWELYSGAPINIRYENNTVYWDKEDALEYANINKNVNVNLEGIDVIFIDYFNPVESDGGYYDIIFEDENSTKIRIRTYNEDQPVGEWKTFKFYMEDIYTDYTDDRHLTQTKNLIINKRIKPETKVVYGYGVRNLVGLDLDGENCEDGIMNGDETEVDKGGKCG